MWYYYYGGVIRILYFIFWVCEPQILMENVHFYVKHDFWGLQCAWKCIEIERLKLRIKIYGWKRYLAKMTSFFFSPETKQVGLYIIWVWVIKKIIFRHKEYLECIPLNVIGLSECKMHWFSKPIFLLVFANFVQTIFWFQRNLACCAPCRWPTFVVALNFLNHESSHICCGIKISQLAIFPKSMAVSSTNEHEWANMPCHSQ